MDVLLLSRIQFALTVGFHFLYPPISIGLGVLLVILQGMYLKTKDNVYHDLVRFWVKIFAAIFAVGVATGIVMEFEFGTNWSKYSRFVGDVFGSPLAAEGVFAFFLESSFLAILLFGWNKVSPKMHFFSTIMVSLGSILSAFWILVANSWQQTPQGYRIVENNGVLRAEIIDFWAMVFNPSTVDRLIHTILASFMTGGFFMISIAAYYLLKKQHIEHAKKMMKIAMIFTAVVSLLELASGHSNSQMIAKHQPAKLAAAEAHFDTLAPGTLYLFGWVDEVNQKVYGVGVPGMLSFLIAGDFNYPVKGLNSFPEDLRPPVNFVFQSYHIMVALGFLMIAISLLGVYLVWKDKIDKTNWFLKILIPSFILPHVANQTGWITAEVGRQPWVVYGLMKTKDAFSPVLDAGQVIFSIVLFTIIYLILLALLTFIIIKKVKSGPVQQITVEK
ncbi:MAG TPA: cytochrome ubiquinol oxidase subunit I [Ignavibacteriales bacterium]|nr:cytochrome ubiquinol oxidase subunit I [Ignavibacteriales bacterium]HPP33720.1 cytochrome ubiquinol oxidase subunit I [Ignavibacteriales bacterium]